MPLPTLTAESFQKQPPGPYAFDRWLSAPLPNPIGSFEVELLEPPDAELLLEINALAQFVTDNPDAVLKAIHEAYLVIADDREWMTICEVPANLPIDRVAQYLSSRQISAERKRDGRIIGTIYFTPQWDEEHGLYLEVLDGKVIAKEL
jgi:hypothetical protein